jgi:hypothetical protein
MTPGGRAAGARHTLDPVPATTTDVFSRDTPPVLTVRPGDTVIAGSLDASGYLARQRFPGEEQSAGTARQPRRDSFQLRLRASRPKRSRFRFLPHDAPDSQRPAEDGDAPVYRPLLLCQPNSFLLLPYLSACGSLAATRQARTSMVEDVTVKAKLSLLTHVSLATWQRARYAYQGEPVSAL